VPGGAIQGSASINLKTAVDAILGLSSNCYDRTNGYSAMRLIGEISNNCKCLWTQIGTELAGVQLLSQNVPRQSRGFTV
jgi:hypothetical protein